MMGGGGAGDGGEARLGKQRRRWRGGSEEVKVGEARRSEAGRGEAKLDVRRGEAKRLL